LARYPSIFSITADKEWIELLDEFFEETASDYSNFPSEDAFLKTEPREFQLALVQPSLILQAKRYQSFSLLKLGSGEKPSIKFLGRLEKNFLLEDFCKTFQATLFRSQDDFSIFLIDDEKEYCERMKGVWEGKKEPLTLVQTAANGLEALEVLRHTKPDIVIVDLKMPVLGGSSFYKQYRQKNQSTPLLILTAVTESAELEKIKETAQPVCIEKSSSESMPDQLWWRALKLKWFGSRDLRSPETGE